MSYLVTQEMLCIDNMTAEEIENWERDMNEVYGSIPEYKDDSFPFQTKIQSSMLKPPNGGFFLLVVSYEVFIENAVQRPLACSIFIENQFCAIYC